MNPQPELVGRRFRPLHTEHPKVRGRVAVVLGVSSSRTTGCGVRLTYRYEDSPPKAIQHVSQRWFLSNFAPIDEASDTATAGAR